MPSGAPRRQGNRRNRRMIHQQLRSQIRVYDEAGNVIETLEHTSPLSPADISLVATDVVDAMVIDDHDTSFGRTNRLRVC
jgi:hypothetical protein